MEKQWSNVLAFYQKNHRMPSFGEMLALTGYKTKSAVAYFVQKLVEQNLVKKDRTGRLVPHKLYGEVKVLGTIEAGFPSAAEEELADTMSFDEYLIENREATYILKVKGDSMIEAGIHPGDMVIVERKSVFKDGQIVVAEIDGAWTLKYFRNRGGKVYLEPGNKKYKPIYPKEELKISAVVKAVVRKY